MTARLTPVSDGQVATSTQLHVELCHDDAAWDDFVASDAESTFSHQAGWRAIMRDVLGHECLYLVARDQYGGWRGVLPLVRVRGMLGHFLVSVPFVNDGGPLGDPVAQQQLVAHAVHEARRSGARLLELRARHAVPGPVAATYRKITVHLPLPQSVQQLWADTFRAKLRSQIRRPLKEGMSARTGATQLAAFYAVFSRNMRDLGTPVMPRRFFERVAIAFGERVLFTCVSTASDEPVAAACTLLWRDEAEIVWASSLREYNQLSPNMLLYARTMEVAITRGARLFNFGRCSAGGATHRFKRQWGGVDVPLPWPSWSRDAHAGIPSAGSSTFRLATTAWTHLPLAVANRVGPVLARQIP